MPQIVHIQPLAPAKPLPGQPCNGCGVCCLYEPCPLGQLLSRRRTGACAALQWDERQALYRCGAMVQPREVLHASLPRGLRWLLPVLRPLLLRLAARWIAAGQGCDCNLSVERPLQSDRQSTP